MNSRLAIGLLVIFLLTGTQAFGFEQDVDPEAEKLLRGLCSYMASLKAYTVKADVYEDRTFSDGENLQFHRNMQTSVQRPDKLRSENLGDSIDRLSFLNGEQYVLLDRISNTYQLLNVPSGLDAAVDFLLEKFNMNIPTADLLKDDPFSAMFPNILTGSYVQKVTIDGKHYHHLAFRQLLVDWQVWIADGDAPLPKRVVITDKTLHGNPQFMVFYSDWNTSPKFADDQFSFSPPEGAKTTELLVPINTADDTQKDN